ncbi:uncharacterized protein BDR25DRAFT_30851 [Lindgomyces ingoldianus]|uniref:Uncharacterized protein n=1 Tax=Lindgomyces ingoldianus TaxID=673940 RepID=A0ACB6QVM6_9PLEO|nr:uncharacterized protein BDR25DRAFT_30851 [Lindgomyces ingoldianus]KAF2470560.1 hypothetical protein BDR25DRAFT_30851 [Lindgomyces ingoldianus]
MPSNSPSFFTLCVASLSSPLSLREPQIRSQTADIFNTISHVRVNLDTSRHLLSSLIRSNSVQPHLRSYCDSVIRDTESALRAVQILVEPLRLDEMEKGRFSWGSRAQWIALDKSRLAEKMNLLSINHQSLTSTIGALQHIASKVPHQYVPGGGDSMLVRPSSGIRSPPMPNYYSPHPSFGPSGYPQSYYGQGRGSPEPTPTYEPNPVMNWKRQTRQPIFKYRDESLSSNAGAAYELPNSPVDLNKKWSLSSQDDRGVLMQHSLGNQYLSPPQQTAVSPAASALAVLEGNHDLQNTQDVRDQKNIDTNVGTQETGVRDEPPVLDEASEANSIRDSGGGLVSGET